MLSTGNKNWQFGIYKTVCCGYEIVLIVRGEFPNCPNHKAPTEWKLVAEIESGEAKKSDSEPAA